jgi:integration host factor subunit alpha
MSAVTKATLISHLFAVLGINKREAREVVDLFFDEISVSLLRGETVKLPEFGVFKTQRKTAREGRNPKTGETVTINPRRIAVFKAADFLKQKAQAYGPIITQLETDTIT